VKAIRFVGVKQPAQIADVPAPRPGFAEVVVAVEAAGLCHSDLHILDGAFPVTPPLTLGHEIAGRVVELGAGVSNTQLLGMPVVLKGTGQGGSIPGLNADGGLAERVLAPANYLLPIPAGISMAQAAVATDSVATAYHAVKGVAGLRLGEKIGIIGLGGLGLNAVSAAGIAGARIIYGCDRSPAKIEAARKAGAHELYADAAELKGKNLDCVIDFVGIGPTVNAAIAAVRNGGRIVLVGLGANQVPLPTLPLITKQISVAGAWGSTRRELVEVMDFIAAGRISSLMEEISLDEVPAGYERLHRGEVAGRLVALIGQ
jgi:alcohol dehydrogenase, propanol-preferring